MEKIDRQIHRLNALVTDLLSFARPHTARNKVIDLPDIARATVDQTSDEYTDLQVTIEGSGTAMADPNLVQHVLLNLVQNAMQATDGKGRVLIRVAPGRILVNDDGPGIPEGMRERIFDPFFTTRTQGTGLGLAISQRAANAMGGQLTLDKGPLPGAAFLLQLGKGPQV